MVCVAKRRWLQRKKLHKGTGHCAVKNAETIATHIFFFGTHLSRDTTHCTSHAHDTRHDMSDHTLASTIAQGMPTGMLK